MNYNSHIKICLAFLLLQTLLCFSFLVEQSVIANGSAQKGLTAQELRGKQIYLNGTASSGGEIFAYLGADSLEVPGSTMPCVNCHGLSGKGKPEAGVNPSDLTWEALTKPYGITHQNGRKHPPYTDRALELAIVRGLDPAGNKLLPVMPRYQMSKTDLADLIAYMKLLGENRQRGVSEDTITIGMIIPTQGPLASLGEAVKATTTGFFEEVNRQGGIYNRKIVLKIVPTGENAEATSLAARRFIQDQEIFALTSAFTAGADAELAALMKELEVPLVGPLTLQPQVGHPLNRYVFYLLSGLADQARVLVNFASRQSTDLKSGGLIAFPDNGSQEMVVNAIIDQCRKEGCGSVEKFSYKHEAFDAAALAGTLNRTNKNVVFFLGSSAEALELVKEADKLHSLPTVYFPGGVGANNLFDAPPGFKNKLILSLPSSPADQTPQGLDEFRAMASKYNLPRNHVASQIMAYSAGKVLVEGMRRCGKDLSAENLITALERLDEYQTGLTPPVTYGPNRRLGAWGAYIVIVDLDKKGLVPAGSWIKLD